METGDYMPLFLTRPFPLPQQAVAILRYFIIRRLVSQDDVATLNEWFDTFAVAPNRRRLRAYIAAPLFSTAERKFNRALKQKLLPYFDVFLPQEDVGLLADFIKRGLTERKAKQAVNDADSEGIQWADVVIAVLDGRSIDEGVVDEIAEGWFRRKPCIGLQTDPRRLLPSGNNLRVECKLTHLYKSEAGLLRWAKRYTLKTAVFE